MYGPVIQGKLVRLRPPRPDDAESMITWFEDLEVTRFIKLRHPPSIDFEKEFLDRMARDPDAIFWVVEHEGRTVSGDKSAWGKGLARELMQLRAAYAFTQLPLRKLKSGYLEGNEASARAQKAAGYKEVGRWTGDRFIDGKWHDHVLTELLRKDWERSHV